jgi:hypothetical protein
MPATQLKLEIGDRLNPEWDDSNAGSSISVQREKLITKDTRVFTIGSCFAVEVRKALRKNGIDVYPKYDDIEFDPSRQAIGKLPARDNVNHYDTFSIRQEFERVLIPERESIELYPHLPVKPGADKKHLDGGALFQDPYRKNVVAIGPEDISQMSRRLDRCIRDAVNAADVYVITLGLIEAWRDRETGRYVWSERVRRLVPDPERIEFHLSDYQENYENMRWVCDLLRVRFPEKKIVVTVSPVGLRKTFTGSDIVVANNYSKSVLRAVAGRLESELENVIYWPSYEISQKMNLFMEDGRHVTGEGVGFIVDNFLRAYTAG